MRKSHGLQLSRFCVTNNNKKVKLPLLLKYINIINLSTTRFNCHNILWLTSCFCEGSMSIVARWCSSLFWIHCLIFNVILKWNISFHEMNLVKVFFKRAKENIYSVPYRIFDEQFLIEYFVWYLATKYWISLQSTKG